MKPLTPLQKIKNILWLCGMFIAILFIALTDREAFVREEGRDEPDYPY